MGLRDLLVLVVVYGSLPIIPFSPFLGLLMFTWLGYMRPHSIAWTLDSTRLSYFVVLAMLFGLGIAWLRGREKLMSIRRETILIIALLVWVAIAGYFAIDTRIASREVNLFAKVVVISLATTGLIRSRGRFRWLMITLSFSVGLLGMKYAVYGLVRGGVNFNAGPGGFMMDNNGFAAGLCMTIPLLLGVASTESRRSVRLFAIGLAACSALTIVFTFSRGGLLGLLVVLGLTVIRTRRPFLVAVMVVMVLILVSVGMTRGDLKEEYLERSRSILDYKEDPSAVGRLKAWSVAFDMFRDRPIVGVGPDNFRWVYPMYGDPEEARVTHNAFLQLLAECGLPAAAIWLTLLMVSILSMEALRRKSRGGWVEAYAWALQTSLIAYFVVSVFLDKAYFDYFYQVVALSLCLRILAAEEGATQSELAPARSQQPWWQQVPVAESNSS